MSKGLLWFRMYAEFATDPDVQSLDFGDQRHYAMLLCLKCAGTLDKDYPSNERRLTVICRALGLDRIAAGEAHRRLGEAGLIDPLWQPTGWARRQFQSDVSTDRVQKHRGKRNGDETFHDRFSNGGVTAPETDTETDTEPPSPPETSPPPDGLDPTAWDRWAAYRREIRKPIKPASLLAAQRKLAGYGAAQAAVVEHSIANGYQGLWEPKNAGRTSPRMSSNETALQSWLAKGGEDRADA